MKLPTFFSFALVSLIHFSASYADQLAYMPSSTNTIYETYLATVCSTYSGTKQVKKVPTSSSSITYYSSFTFSDYFYSTITTTSTIYGNTTTRTVPSTTTKFKAVTSTKHVPTVTTFTCATASDTLGVAAGSQTTATGGSAAGVHGAAAKAAAVRAAGFARGQSNAIQHGLQVLAAAAKLTTVAPPVLFSGTYPTLVSCLRIVETITAYEVYTGTYTETMSATLYKNNATSTVTQFIPSVTKTTTKTTTTTTTIGSTTKSSAAANPSGLLWGLYSNNQGDDDDADYSKFDPTLFKQMSPEFSNVSYEIGGIQDVSYDDYYHYGPPGDYYEYISHGAPDYRIYNSSYTFEWLNFTVNHKFYINAQQTGTYTIKVDDYDDIVLVWVGGNAFTNWTRANAVIDQTIQSATSYTPYQFNMTAGDYMAVRVMYAQASGPLSFQMEVIAPDGTDLFGQDGYYGVAPGTIVQYSCDGVSAPVFPAFGNES